MPEIFQAASTAAEAAVEHTALDYFSSLGLAMVAGLVIAGVYSLSQKRPPGQMLPMFTTLVLLTMLVAMTTIVIGDSVARAFGLVGALSIVRFRTIVDDTRDTSFVIFAVVVGMAMGSGHVVVCLIGVPLVSLVAIGLSAIGNGLTASAAAERRLDIRIGAGRDPEVMFPPVFKEHLKTWRLLEVVSARQGAAIDIVYRVRLFDPKALIELIKAVSAIEGVQSVDLKQ